MEVNLKSNGWYNKLQAWTLGEAKPDLFSLCPFFWLTVFCLIASPITLIIKFFGGVVKLFEKQLELKLDKWIANMGMDEVIGLYNDEFQNKPFSSKKLTPFKAWKRWIKYMESTGMDRSDIDAKFDDAYTIWKEKSAERAEAARIENEKNQEARETKEIKDAARLQRRKNAWIPIVLWTKRIVNLVITILIMAIVTYLINLLIANFNGSATLDGLIVLGYVLAGIVVLVFFGYLIYMYANWCRDNNKTPTIFKPFIFVGIPTGRFFAWIGRGIGNAFGLFWEYFKANKNDYCPAINWDAKKTSK